MGLHVSRTSGKPIRRSCLVWGDQDLLIPGGSGSNHGAKKALKARYQCRKRRRLREDAAARKMRCVNDQDSCMGMMAEMIEENRRGMVCVSRVVDHFEETFRSDFEKMRSATPTGARWL